MYSEQEAKRFIEYFQEELVNVMKVKSRLFKKILLFTIIDCLGTSCDCPRKSHHEKILHLISELSNWNDQNKVSSPQLAVVLKNKGLSDQDLYKKVYKKIGSWTDGQEPQISNDFEFQELSDEADENTHKTLEKHRHRERLYEYRNTLIHEFREPGYSFEHDDEEMPYYLMIDDNWELAYPVNFIKMITWNILCALPEYFKKHNINPYENYSFGSPWGPKII
ncbi:MAG: hypothetical protein K9N34_10675 [Candidatus Marinimicrobia bacterium]|nr:hypothetical protein [Candidatus Neomarinimicrobiota bacterium]